ncbi:efflux RND transporter periplasmic adaptor subunit [Desulforhopalus vacuolatus]|uniref:efflux RND transporter periplasmic adaptor subunit n=1 Tax=Desulforhopalus vacuolatus TaxID=40414 RepID=UPI0019645060|nr:efflux RND transporter periplasmic adaptor subunit [Desulforhopalus vacuolatus]MBM9520000.1 efflux RND transporter periplasmic adaptor subunit [Desulforhopalus vacuolatus]
MASLTHPKPRKLKINPSKTMKKYFLSVSILFLFLTACSHNAEETQPREQLPLVQAIAVAAVKAPAPHSLEVSGTVEAVTRADISAQTSGNILAIPVKLGQRVEKGEILVELDQSSPKARLREAEVSLAQAQRNLSRESRLLSRNAATPENVKNLKDTVAIARARVNQANTSLSFTRIRAPFSGIISAKPANTGDLATPGQSLVRLEDLTRLEVVADIPETLLDGIHVGEVLPVEIPSADITLKGTVSEISPAVNPASRTAPATLSLDPQDTAHIRLSSGMFARIRLPLTTLADRGENLQSIFVPEAALQRYGQLERVFVLTGGHAVMRIVRIGTTINRNGEMLLEILSGLDAGEKVLLSPIRLHNGQPIELMTATQAEVSSQAQGVRDGQ